MRYDRYSLPAVANWINALEDHRYRTSQKVLLDKCEVWADGELVGHINIDGDDYIFVPISEGAST